MTTPLALSDFDFALPPELIAQHPLSERSASRLLDGRADVPVERRFHDLSELLLVKGVTREMYYGGGSSNSPAPPEPRIRMSVRRRRMPGTADITRAISRPRTRAQPSAYRAP